MALHVVDTLREHLANVPATERRVAHRLLAEYPMAGLQSASELARAVGVSTPTVLRLVARLGFENYADFQKTLRDELAAQLSSPLNKARSRPDPASAAGGFAAALARNIEDTFLHLAPGELDRVAAVLADRRNRVHLVGGRFTDALARYLAVQLRVLRPGVHHLEDQEANWQDQLLDFGRQDVLVLFDIRRYQPSLLRLADAAARRRARVILFTDPWLSPVARVALHVLPARVVAPSIWDSSAALMALCEALLAAVTTLDWPYAEQRMRELEQLRQPHNDVPPAARDP